MIFGSLSAYADAATEEQRYDVRVLIDVSGSMKKNDPKNLRIPALKLLVNLLPPESKAGIWLFSENSNQLVAVGKVDKQWKQQALKSSTSIHSRGLFTDIEKVLIDATKDWAEADSNSKRSLILLTDGVVDVSKSPEKNRQSTKRIVEQLLPRLQQTSARVYTIALSENADQGLLEKIAFATGGWSESAKTSDQLQRTFLKIFKKAVPRDSVPLQGNTFSIDSSIKEFSLLVFRKADAKETALIEPDKTVLSKDAKSDNVQWLHEPGYDLITVKNPSVGEWRFNAEIDPDNEVLVLTDLNLKVSELPNYVNEKEPLDIVATMTDQGTPISRSDFLDMVQVTLLQTDELMRKRDWPISRSGNEFKLRVSDTMTAGKQTLTVIANGNTFQRQVSQTIKVVSNPVTVKTAAENNGDTPYIKVIVSADATVIDPVTMIINATITDKAGESTAVKFKQEKENWLFRLKAPHADERLVINFDIDAKTFRGNEITPQLTPLIIDGNQPIETALPEKKQSAIENSDKPAAENAESSLEEPIEEVDWMMTGIIATIINILVIVGVYFSRRYLKQREHNYQTQLLDRLAT